VLRSWQPRPIGQELDLCRRYCELIGGDINTSTMGAGVASGATGAIVVVYYYRKRIVPSITLTSAGNYQIETAIVAETCTALSVDAGFTSLISVILSATVTLGLTANGAVLLISVNAQGTIVVDADL